VSDALTCFDVFFLSSEHFPRLHPSVCILIRPRGRCGLRERGGLSRRLLAQVQTLSFFLTPWTPNPGGQGRGADSLPQNISPLRLGGRAPPLDQVSSCWTRPDCPPSVRTFLFPTQPWFPPFSRGALLTAAVFFLSRQIGYGFLLFPLFLKRFFL